MPPHLEHEPQQEDHGHAGHDVRMVLHDELVAQHRRVLVALLADRHGGQGAGRRCRRRLPAASTAPLAAARKRRRGRRRPRSPGMAAAAPLSPRPASAAGSSPRRRQQRPCRPAGRPSLPPSAPHRGRRGAAPCPPTAVRGQKMAVGCGGGGRYPQSRARLRSPPSPGQPGSPGTRGMQLGGGLVMVTAVTVAAAGSCHPACSPCALQPETTDFIQGAGTRNPVTGKQKGRKADLEVSEGGDIKRQARCGLKKPTPSWKAVTRLPQVKEEV